MKSSPFITSKRLPNQYLLNPLMWLFSPLDFAHTHTHSCTITHITGICKHTTMNELTFYQITLFTHCLKTPTNYLHPQQYACIDEYSNCSVDWMPYYIIYRYNGTHHYICIYGLSDYSCYCMPYYILHSNTGSLHYVCVDVF